MSTWTAPATWANAAVTAAQMNAEIRDHATFLKGALDLITNSTTADTGTATYLRIVRAADSDPALYTAVSGDGFSAFALNADGGMTWGGGSAARDTSLIRNDAGDMTLASNGAATPTVVRVEATSGQRSLLGVQVAGDTQLRTALYGDATGRSLEFGYGNATRDIRLYHVTTGEVAFDANATANPLAVRVIGTSGQRSLFGVQVSGDSAARAALYGDATEQSLTLGPGSGTRDIRFRRSAAGSAYFDANGAAVAANLNVSTIAGQRAYFTVRVDGDANARTVLYGDATSQSLEFGNGTSTRDVNLYRNAADDLRTDDHFYAAELAVPVKAGTPSDSDTTIDMSGNVILDTTNSRIYFRVGSTWKYASLT